MELDGLLWTLVIIIGPLLLGIFLFVYGRRRRLNRVEQEISEQGTRENWGKERIR